MSEMTLRALLLAPYHYIVMASTISFGDRNYGIQGGIVNGPVSAAFHLPPG